MEHPRTILVIATAVLVGGCAASQRRARAAAEPRIVRIPELCHVSPLPPLPTLKRQQCGPGRRNWVCFDGANSKALAAHVAAMEAWIADVRRSCGTRQLPGEPKKGAPRTRGWRAASP